MYKLGLCYAVGMAFSWMQLKKRHGPSQIAQEVGTHSLFFWKTLPGVHVQITTLLCQTY